VSKKGPPTVRFIWGTLGHFLDHVERGGANGTGSATHASARSPRPMPRRATRQRRSPRSPARKWRSISNVSSATDGAATVREDLAAHTPAATPTGQPGSPITRAKYVLAASVLWSSVSSSRRLPSTFGASPSGASSASRALNPAAARPPRTQTCGSFCAIRDEPLVYRGLPSLRETARRGLRRRLAAPAVRWAWPRGSGTPRSGPSFGHRPGRRP
jgi:hypothetical protein